MGKETLNPGLKKNCKFGANLYMFSLLLVLCTRDGKICLCCLLRATGCHVVVSSSCDDDEWKNIFK